MGDMYFSRVLSHGKITDLASGFKLGNSIPFSLYIRKKTVTMSSDVVASVKLICDNNFGEFPLPIGDWTPGEIVEIAPNAISLADYDVYYGAGEKIV